jgi:hypothetical protein
MRRSVIAGFCVLLLTACANDRSPNEVTQPGGLSSLQPLMDVTEGLNVTSGQTGTWNWAGQSFVVPQGGSFTDVHFNFYSFKKEPVAFGNLYLLTQEYLGLPSGLSASTPGFVGRSETTANGVYTFGTSVVINGGTKYWVYTDTQGAFAGSFDTDIYPAGDQYVTGIASQPFRKTQASGRMVNGTFVPAPAGVFTDANFKLEARSK